MNLVEQIKNQFSSGVINQVSSQLGASEDSTRTAIWAGVPALLAGLNNIAATRDGADRIVSALGQFDSNSVSRMLNDKPGAVMDQGSNMLGSLFGNNTLSGIVSALAKYSGLGSTVVQKLLGFLMPMVMGSLAGRFDGRPKTAEGLSRLFVEERGAITNSAPSGFSLADVPGLANPGTVLSSEPPQTSSPMYKWLAPVAGVAALAVVLFFAFRGTPPANIPAVEVTKELNSNLNTLTGRLTDIKDEQSAQSALTELKKVSTALNNVKTSANKVAEADRSKITEAAKSQFNKIEEQAIRVMWVPGADKVKPTVDEIMDKIASMGGITTSKAPAVSNDLARSFTTLTDALGTIKDVPTAEAALPRLTELSGNLEAARSAFDKLSDTNRNTIASMVKSSLERLKTEVDRVQAQAGVGAKLQPVMDAIMKKLNAFAA
jgi:hypothetical protein